MPNRLAQEASPYLRQHASNPVDWYPWGEAALQQAREQNRPILLSVGYSACHWCHVMEHESFSDPDTAAQMNENFINIKVDREERPDLDEIYMQAVQAFTGGHGGWPMTVFLTPEGKPFFGGTYFPPVAGRGMPAFREVLQYAAELYHHQQEQVAEITEELGTVLRSSARLPRPAEQVGEGWLDKLAEASEHSFDDEQGGFSPPPKFPPHGLLAALLTHAALRGPGAGLDMALFTLDRMALGGMYDLIGGGFARYSVDNEWRIPHFEKMLYDNAQLVPCYLDAWLLTRRPHYARIAKETLDFVLRELSLPGGGFCAAFDADSEGEEGKFYVWTPAEIRAVVGMFDGLRACSLLEVSDAGNFEHGQSVLRLEQPIEALDEADRALLERVYPQLYAARAQRVWPGRDDKIVVAWNGLMIAALARGATALNEPRYAEAAARAADFILSTLLVDGRLHRTWLDGRLGPAGCLDDYADLVHGLIELHQATQELRWLGHALSLADQMVARFWDESDGAFFYTAHDAEALLLRSKKLIGGAEPSGNGMAAWALSRLAVLSDRRDLGEKADRILRAYRSVLDRAPGALGYEAIAAAWRTATVHEIGVVGPDPGPMLAALRARPLPLAVIATTQDATLLPWMEGKTPIQGQTAAYVCRNYACLAPVTTPAALIAAVEDTTRPSPGAGRLHAPALSADPADWLNSLPLELKGQVVVLDFWTYCCINCMHVLPELTAIEETFAGDSVVVIGVHSAKFPAEQERENVARALSRHDVRHPVVHDPTHTLWEAYTVRSWPTIVVLDAQGRIAFQKGGEVRRNELIPVVRRLLDEARVTGALQPPVWRRPAADAAGDTLRFPGKVQVWPDGMAQARGQDIFAMGSRLYVADTGHHRILEYGVSQGFAGWPDLRLIRTFGDGVAGLVDGESPRFDSPQGMAREGQTLWVADTGNHALRAIDLKTGEVRTVAGNGKLGRGGGNPRKPRELALRSPWDVAAQEGVVFVAMAGTHQIWIYQTNEDVIAPIVGTGQEAHIDGEPQKAALAQPSGLCLFGRFLFWADSEISSIRFLDLQTRKVGTVVGRGLFDFGDIDGLGGDVRLQHPLGVTFADGRLYVADTFNNKLKTIRPDNGETRTLLTGLAEPGGIVAFGPFLIVADTNHHRIIAVQRSTGELRVLVGEGA